MGSVKERTEAGKKRAGGKKTMGYRIVKEPALSDFHTNSRATAGNHSKIKIIHHPRAIILFRYLI